MVRAHNQYRRATKRTIFAEKFLDLEIFERDCWTCQICGKRVNRRLKFPHPRSKSLDHIIPLSVPEGHHTRQNVQLAHLSCNLSKRASRNGQLRLVR
ncbi:MAG: HNH endonuclease [Phycisphaerae bacterium]|nr:HNH endonuclease [Phycisphaerae bacterium]